MNSKSWAKRRLIWFNKHGKWCRSCETKSKIHLHHRTYVRMGQELDSDLIALCEKCHSLLHQYQRDTGYSVEDATKVFMSMSQGSDPSKKKHKHKQKKQVKEKKAYQPKSLKKIIEKESDFVPLNRRPDYVSPYERHSTEASSYAMQKERRLAGLPIVRFK